MQYLGGGGGNKEGLVCLDVRHLRGFQAGQLKAHLGENDAGDGEVAENGVHADAVVAFVVVHVEGAVAGANN